jgi:hypothetical protein
MIIELQDDLIEHLWQYHPVLYKWLCVSSIFVTCNNLHRCTNSYSIITKVLLLMKPVMCFLNSTLAHTDMLDFFLKVSMQLIVVTVTETSTKLTKLLLRQVVSWTNYYWDNYQFDRTIIAPPKHEPNWDKFILTSTTLRPVNWPVTQTITAPP